VLQSAQRRSKRRRAIGVRPARLDQQPINSVDLASQHQPPAPLAHSRSPRFSRPSRPQKLFCVQRGQQPRNRVACPSHRACGPAHWVSRCRLGRGGGTRQREGRFKIKGTDAAEAKHRSPTLLWTPTARSTTFVALPSPGVPRLCSHITPFHCPRCRTASFEYSRTGIPLIALTTLHPTPPSSLDFTRVVRLFSPACTPLLRACDTHTKPTRAVETRGTGTVIAGAGAATAASAASSAGPGEGDGW
ncbi:hypothetical protein GALMADRAFT_157410, partial [Galerina marginata CBS 339.88]